MSMLEPTATVPVHFASCDRVPHATPLHEERAASSVNEQAAAAAAAPIAGAAAAISQAIDDVDVSQREARAFGHFDGARHALGIEGRTLGADTLERQVDASDHEWLAAEEDAAGENHHARV